MKRRFLVFSAIAALALGVVSSCKPRADIIIAGKEYTEQLILANMVADLIEGNTDLKVGRKDSLGGTLVIWQAMKKKSVDMYIEYTGTADVTILGNQPSSDPAEVYNRVKNTMKDDHGYEALAPFGFNNTYVITVTQAFAAEHNLSKISDLAGIANILRGGFTYEFMEREDGILGLETKGGFTFGQKTAIEGNLRYTALLEDEINVTSAFATDSLIQKLDLFVLEDDLTIFPPYFAFPLIGAEILEKYPILVELMNQLRDVLTDDNVMVQLNYRVDELQEEPKEVARAFLIEKGLISG